MQTPPIISLLGKKNISSHFVLYYTINKVKILNCMNGVRIQIWHTGNKGKAKQEETIREHEPRQKQPVIRLYTSEWLQSSA